MFIPEEAKAAAIASASRLASDYGGRCAASRVLRSASGVKDCCRAPAATRLCIMLQQSWVLTVGMWLERCQRSSHRPCACRMQMWLEQRQMCRLIDHISCETCILVATEVGTQRRSSGSHDRGPFMFSTSGRVRGVASLRVLSWTFWGFRGPSEACMLVPYNMYMSHAPVCTRVYVSL